MGHDMDCVESGQDMSLICRYVIWESTLSDFY